MMTAYGKLYFTVKLKILKREESQYRSRTTDTQWRHKSKISEKLGRRGRQNMLRPHIKFWEWEQIFDRVVKAIYSLGIYSPWYRWKVYKILGRIELNKRFCMILTKSLHIIELNWRKRCGFCLTKLPNLDNYFY